MTAISLLKRDADEGRFWTDVGTDRGVTEPPIISGGPAPPPKYKVSPSILRPEAEGPPIGTVVLVYDEAYIKDNVPPLPF